MSYFRSDYLIAARALAAKDWSHPKIIQIARHMAHQGASVAEINDAVGWGVKIDCAYSRLRKFNIRPHGAKNKSAHRGELTTLPHGNAGVSVDFYRPKQIGAAQ